MVADRLDLVGKAVAAGPISPELKQQMIETLVEKVQADTVERWGVQQSELTIVYRFGQPNEPSALCCRDPYV